MREISLAARGLGRRRSRRRHRGVAINLLLEQDDIMGPDVEDMTDSLEGAGQRLLWMLSRYASDERMARIAGPRACGTSSRGGPGPRRLRRRRVQVGAGVPQSKAAKQAAIQEVLNMLAQSGVLQQLDERDLRSVLQEYEVGGLEKFFGRTRRRRAPGAAREPALAAGEQLGDQRVRQRPAHIAGHEEYQKTSAWDAVDRRARRTSRRTSTCTSSAPGGRDAMAAAPAAGRAGGAAACCTAGKDPSRAVLSPC
jgi:hypothetical protein